jgi:ABC-type multidrug transport system fused ATPase/permease subunit
VLAITALLAAVSAVLEIAVITIIAAFAGRLLSEDAAVPVFSDLSDGLLVAVAGVVVAAKVTTDLLFAKMQSRSLYDYEAGLRRQIAFLQARCGWATIEDSEAGSIHSLLWTSVHRSRDGFGQLIGIFTNVTSLALMLAAVIVTAHWMVVPVFAGIVVFGLIFYPLIRATKHASLELRHAYQGYGAELNESIAMSREARVLGVQDQMAARLADAGDLAARSVARQAFYSNLMASGYSNALYAAVIFGFALLTGAEINDPAPLAATVLLLYRSLSYGRGLQSSLQSMTAAAPFVADVHQWLDVLEATAETIDEAPAVDGFASIAFRDVGLTYANGHEGLRGVSTTIERGDSVALVGASGSGKSSLITLLLGLRDHTAGSIAINGQPIEEVDRRSWRSLLALVPQDNMLFDDTIEENVRCWRDISNDRILESLRQANILEEVLAMEDGLSSTVGEGGKRLSGGQRQRICLARALAGDPALLVLDEPTSALDPASERAVKDSLEAIKGQVTLVIIAHRMTTITICDRVLVLDRGQLEHDGPPEVVARDSEYFARALELSDGA